jgi:hypothetical protein
VKVQKNRDASFKASLPIRTKEKNKALANKNAHIFWWLNRINLKFDAAFVSDL